MKQVTIIFLFFYFSINAFSQTYIAKIKDSIASADLIMNDSIIGKIYRNERFIVTISEADTFWEVYTKSTKFGSMNSEFIELLPNEKIFKICTDTSDLFRSACGHHEMDNFSSFGINYCKVVREATNGNEKSLLRLFLLYDTLYAAPAETHPYTMWLIFNNWSDHPFSLFLKNNQKFISLRSWISLMFQSFLFQSIL
jgi:hypothetical protein